MDLQHVRFIYIFTATIQYLWQPLASYASGEPIAGPRMRRRLAIVGSIIRAVLRSLSIPPVHTGGCMRVRKHFLNNRQITQSNFISRKFTHLATTIFVRWACYAMPSVIDFVVEAAMQACSCIRGSPEVSRIEKSMVIHRDAIYKFTRLGHDSTFARPTAVYVGEQQRF